MIFDFWHCRLKLPKNGLSTYKAGRTQNALTFKPRYKNCPDFDSDAPPTPGHPGLKEIAWESQMPIFVDRFFSAILVMPGHWEV